jgi:predicted nucleic acid-binding protein
MIVIADASPLRYLIEIGHANILAQLFGQVIVPTAVAQELQHAKTPDPVHRWIASPPAWVVLRRPSTDDANLSYLGAGEKAAILLGSELHADAIILDDAEGRREASRRGLRVLGTLRILDEAAAQHLIDLPSTLHRLRLTGFRVTPKLLDWLVSRHRT